MWIIFEWEYSSFCSCHCTHLQQSGNHSLYLSRPLEWDTSLCSSLEPGRHLLTVSELGDLFPAKGAILHSLSSSLCPLWAEARTRTPLLPHLSLHDLQAFPGVLSLYWLDSLRHHGFCPDVHIPGSSSEPSRLSPLLCRRPLWGQAPGWWPDCGY